LKPIVIDNGNSFIKAGFSGDENPDHTFPTLLGRPTQHRMLIGEGASQSVFIGDQAIIKRSILKLERPLSNGVVNDWDSMQEIWKYTFDTKLGVPPDSHPLVMLISPQTPSDQIYEMAKVFFSLSFSLSICLFVGWFVCLTSSKETL